LEVVRSHRQAHRLARDEQLREAREDIFARLPEGYRKTLEEFQQRSRNSRRQTGDDSTWQDEPVVGTIVSAYHLSMVEQTRAERQISDHSLNSLPVDAFVWALGEPEHRHATKIGGVPYRPTGALWPTIARDDEPNEKCRKRIGEPMTFLAQFCFAGSRDIFPDLPGDVLLIFAEDDQFSRPEALHFEWQSLGIGNLVEAANVPEPDWQFVTCFGYRHRTCDYVSAELASGDRGRAGEHVHILGCTKIGGAPFLIQPPFERREEPESWPGRLLAQLSSISPGTDHYYPWVNREEPFEVKEITRDMQLNLCDDGFLYVFISPDGSLTWEFETY
jgi:hypothetical protein